MPTTFLSSLGVRFDIPAVVREIVRFIKIDPKRKYKVIIGTDSEQTGGAKADFVTAIVVHRVGNGGIYFFRRNEFGKFHTLRDRIIQEVLISLEVAEKVLNELRNQAKEVSWDFEIHADVGENGPTSTLIQEVTGIVRASNFTVKTKPDSYAASKVADRHV
jgi:hypothetical protein